MQKITVEVPKTVLAGARKYLETSGVTDTIRQALEECARKQAMQDLKKLKGSFTPSISIEEMRSWEEDDPVNPWNHSE